MAHLENGRFVRVMPDSEYPTGGTGCGLTTRGTKCGLTNIRRSPDITTLIIEVEEPAGPFGTRGIAEFAAIPTAPAVLNAIYDAVRLRITELPATPGRVRAGTRV